MPVPPQDIVREFLDHSDDMLERVGKGLADLKRTPRDAVVMERMSSALHAIRSGAGFLSLTEVETVAAEAEGLLREARTRAKAIDAAGMGLLAGAVNAMYCQFARLRDGSGENHPVLEVSGAPSESAPTNQIEFDTDASHAAGRMEAVFADQPPSATQDVERIPDPALDTDAAAAAHHVEAQFTPPASPAAAQSPADLARIDAMLSDLASLMVQTNKVAATTHNLPGNEACTPLGAEMSNLAEDLRQASGEIKDSVLSVRARSMAALFEACRMAAETLSRDIDSEIRLSFGGAEVEADQSVVERLQAPLLEGLRLLVSTGDVSSPVSLAIQALAEDSFVRVSITRESGTIRPAELESGLAAIRAALGAIRGTIDVANNQPQGTSTTSMEFRVPTNLAFLDAMLVRIDGETIAVPMESTEEVVRPEPKSLARLGGLQAIPLRNGVVAMLDGRAMLGLTGSDRSLQPYALVIRQGDRRVALSISKPVGRQEIVIRPTDSFVNRRGPILGAGAREDGGATLILDVPALFRQADKDAEFLPVAA